MIISQYIIVLILSLVASLIFVPIARFTAIRFKILDHPNPRKIHKYPIPRLGGIAIYLAFIIGVLSSCDYNVQLKGILIGSSIIFFTGFIDDIRHLSVYTRLMFQILAGIIIVMNGIVIKVFHIYFINVIATVVGLIGISNALNFLDNMDGLAAGISIICSFGIASIAYRTGQRWLVYLSVSLIGSSLGFLRYNFKPAKIFMGDSGSTFLGFTIGAMSIMASWSNYAMISITIPVLILGIMIFDTVMITSLRIFEGKVRTVRQWLEHVDMDHISHRLVDMGLSQRETVMFIYICNLILAGIAISLPRDGVKSASLTLLAYILISAWAIWKLHTIKQFHKGVKRDERKSYS